MYSVSKIMTVVLKNVILCGTLNFTHVLSDKSFEHQYHKNPRDNL